MTCSTCNKEIDGVIYATRKQIGGEYKAVFLCEKCNEQHKRELEMTRENFRRQFGEN